MPAPKRFPDRDEIAAVLVEAEPLENGAQAETTRRLAGRVLARRDMGKLVFLDLVAVWETLGGGHGSLTIAQALGPSSGVRPSSTTSNPCRL